MRIRTTILPLILILLVAVLVGGCTGSSETPEPAGTVSDTVRSAMEPKPTFTPLSPDSKATTVAVDPTATEAGEQETPTSSPTTAATSTAEPTATATEASMLEDWQVMQSPAYGMQAFLWWRPEVAHRDLGLIKDAGFGWVKQDLPWREIEGAGKGQFDWSRADTVVEMAHDDFGLNILARVDRQPAWANPNCVDGANVMGPPQNYQDYADFLTELASRYRGRIAAYAVWNEPNLSREWCNEPPNPEEYVRLLQVAYDAIKAGDPNAIVVSAGLSPTGGPMPTAMDDVEYLDRMYQAMGGDSSGYFDVLGAHAPGFKAPPEVSTDEVAANPEQYGRGRWFTFRRVEELRDVMEQYGDTQRQVAILEMGWTVDPRPGSPYNWHAVTEEQQADYLVRAYEYAEENWRPWIGLMSLIYVCNADWDEDDEQYYWCITYPIYPQTVTRPAYDALKAMPK